MTSASENINTTGVLAIWHDIEADEDMERELFEWYNREHHNERFEIPGFVRARRYEALEGSPRIFSRYDTTSPEVLSSDAYLQRVNNPSQWTQRTMPHYRNMSRTVCEIAQRFGRGEGGKIATLRIDPTSGTEKSELVEWIRQHAIPKLVDAPGIIGGQLLAAVPGASSVGSAEKNMRGDADTQCPLSLLVTGSSVQAVKDACEGLVDSDSPLAQGASVTLGVYELVFDLSTLDGDGQGR